MRVRYDGLPPGRPREWNLQPGVVDPVMEGWKHAGMVG